MSKPLAAALGWLLLLSTTLCGAARLSAADGSAAKPGRTGATQVYAGFDKNDYPGDDLLPALHNSFAFTGYWLNDPPGTGANHWLGKRALLRSKGFGFLVLFNGRLYADLKAAESASKDSAGLGRSDAATAIAAALLEGFPTGAIIFLDHEEGGHLLPEQSAYIFAWVDAVRRSAYRPGVYCSGIGIGSDGANPAGDIRQHYRARIPVLWISNDQCPPAPGCTIPGKLPSPSGSGAPGTTVWQYAQSPRRPEFTAACVATYAADNRCYAPGIAPSFRTAIDLDIANSPDPSHGR